MLGYGCSLMTLVRRVPKLAFAYCRDGDIEEGDVEQAYEQFTAWFQGQGIPFLEDALVDYSADRMGSSS